MENFKRLRKHFLGGVVSVVLAGLIGGVSSTVAQAADSSGYSYESIAMSGSATTNFDAQMTYRASVPSVNAFWDYQGKYHVAYITGSSWQVPGSLVIQRYNSDLALENSIEIKPELPLFGNVICDGEYYYVVWGQNDSSPTGTKPVICVSKYTLDGAKVAFLEMTGFENGGSDSGTCNPFDAGCCKLDLQNGILACNYGRKMYNGHQSDFVFFVDTRDMSRANTTSSPVYCSHSFDQATLATSDGGYMFVNHGDAYNRGFQLAKVSSMGTAISDFYSFHFREGANRSYGYNETFAQLGGLIETHNAYVLCGASNKTFSYELASSTGYYGFNEPRDLFIQVVKKDFYNYSNKADRYVVGGTSRTATGTSPVNGAYKDTLYLYFESRNEPIIDYGVVWLTNYQDKEYVSNPKIVNADDYVVVMWEKRTYTGSTTYTGDTYYLIMDSNYEIVVPATRIASTLLPGNADLSYRNGCVYWTTKDTYGTKINKLNIYSLVQENNKTAAINGYNILLDGRIGVSCSISMSDAMAKSGNGSMVYYVDGERYQVKTFAVKKGEDNTYTATFYLSSKQMTDDIMLELYDGDILLDSTTMSVARYANVILNGAATNSEYKNAEEFVKAMLNYGAYSQIYFDYNVEHLANDGVYTASTDPVLNQNISIPVSGYSTTYLDFGDAGISYMGSSLVCGDSISLKLYCNISEGYQKPNVLDDLYMYTSGVARQICDPEYTTVVYTITNISPKDLNKSFTVQQYRWSTSKWLTLNYSPMIYLNQAVNCGDEKMANLAKAMYLYHKAATDYKG